MHARLQIGTSFEKTHMHYFKSYLFYNAIDKDNWEEEQMKENLREMIGN